MPLRAAIYRLFIASPGDVVQERDLIEKTIHEWNGELAEHFGVYFQPTRWETDAVPRQGVRGQEVINEDLVDRADLLIGVFWSRLGSPSGAYTSGTLEELIRFKSTGKSHALLFKRAALPFDHDQGQLTALKDFQKGIRSNPDGEFSGLTRNFESDAELHRIVHRFLSYHAGRIHQRNEDLDRSAEKAKEVDLAPARSRASSYFDSRPDFGAMWSEMKARKACLSLAQIGPIQYGGPRVKVAVKFRNEGEYPAYDLRLTATDESGSQLGSASANELVPASRPPQTGRISPRDYQPRERELEISLPYPAEREGRQALLIRLNASFRDGLDRQDEAVFVLSAKAQGKQWTFEEDRAKAELSNLCRFVRPDLQ